MLAVDEERRERAGGWDVSTLTCAGESAHIRAFDKEHGGWDVLLSATEYMRVMMLSLWVVVGLASFMAGSQV